MPSGPSKQDLEMYWQSSRQYFDELANYYKQSDPAYYKEYILPFYSNPFRSGLGSASGGSKPRTAAMIFALAGFLVIAALGAGVFLLMQDDTGRDSTERDKKEVTRSNESPGVVKDTHDFTPVAPPEITSPVPEVEPREQSIHYSRGLDLYRRKEYSLAEKYLKYVPESDPNYEDAGRMLKEIKDLKSGDKTTDNRKKPIERIR
jgi:hypothetical protein